MTRRESTPVPPEARVAHFLARARRRLVTLALLQAASGASIAAAAALVVARSLDLGPVSLAALVVLSAIAGGGLAAWKIGRWQTAAEVERRTPAFRNVLVTAGELLTGERRVKPNIRELVLRDTSARIEGVDLREVAPARRTLFALSLSAAALIAAIVAGGARTDAAPAMARLAGADGAGAPAFDAIDVRVVAPGYTGAREARYANPERVELIAGSTVHVRARANASAVTLTAGDRTMNMARTDDDTFGTSLTVEDETFLSLAPFAATEGTRAVIQLTITPDRAPEARIDTPGRDLMLADAAREVPVHIVVRDDFGL